MNYILFLVLIFVNLKSVPPVQVHFRDTSTVFELSELNSREKIRNIEGKILDSLEFSPFEIDFLCGCHFNEKSSFNELKNQIKDEARKNLVFYYAGKANILSGINSYILFSKDKTVEPPEYIIDVYLLNCIGDVLVSCANIASLHDYNSVFPGSGSNYIYVSSVDSGSLVSVMVTLFSDILDINGEMRLPQPESFHLSLMEDGTLIGDNMSEDLPDNAIEESGNALPWIMNLIMAILVACVLFFVLF